MNESSGFAHTVESRIEETEETKYIFINHVAERVTPNVMDTVLSEWASKRRQFLIQCNQLMKNVWFFFGYFETFATIIFHLNNEKNFLGIRNRNEFMYGN